ncbi:unnamed protein product [Rhizophagus irregularis]|nr:unnamed protein product [Rhizophagus irregularis]
MESCWSLEIKHGYIVLPRPSRPPILTERDIQHLTNILKRDRKVNFGELREDFVNSTTKNVCKKTLNDLNDQENYLFQEDNVPMHTARIVKSWKEENEVNSIPWPIQSPDLSTIG